LTEARYSPEALAVGERAVIAAAENSPRPVTPGVAAIEQEVEGEKSLEERYQEPLDTSGPPHNQQYDVNA
jgi:hypothetical protein